MYATRAALSICALTFAALSFLATGSASAGDQHTLRPDFLWFVSGHGVNVSEIADGDGSPLAITKLASIGDVPPAAAAHAKIGEIRAAMARLQTPGEHVLPAGYIPGGANADLAAARLLSRLGSDVDAVEIVLVIGIDLMTGVERALVGEVRAGRLLDLETADVIADGFLPLYSVGQDRVRIHFKSDSQRRPAIDRSALSPFGSRKGDVFGLYGGAEAMPVAVLARAIPTP